MFSNTLGRLVPSSLARRLVVTTITLVALVSLLVAGLTSFAMYNYLTGRLDIEVKDSLARAVGASERAASSSDPFEEQEHEESDVRIPIGQAAGTITAKFDAEGDRGDVVTTGGARQSLSSEALSRLRALQADGGIHAVDLPELGTYRVMSRETGTGTLVAGLPTHDLDESLASLLLWELGLALAGVGLAALLGQLAVSRQLKPLRDVAATAHELTQMELSSGEVGVTVRVDERLSDPRTEVGQVGAALNRMLGHVEQALDARYRSEQQVRQFVADASHELRTPLATIHGYAELTRRTSTPDAEQLAMAMAKVEAEANRMASLVEDLLLLARLDSGRPVDRKEVDLTQLVAEAVNDARVVSVDHLWRLILPDEPVTVVGDEQRLHQVLTNLLTNARLHTPPGTTTSVAVLRSSESTETRESVLITVHDDGPGVPANLASKVFERFSRGDASRNRASGGAGLGLSIVQAIVQAHGGTVTLTSAPGDTTFAIRLAR